MAAFDSADLLARLRTFTGRDSDDELLTEPLGYELLADAQRAAVLDIAARVPHAMMGAPVLLTSADGGSTYTFGTDDDGNAAFVVGHCEVYARDGGQTLYASSYGDGEGDFVIEGDRIRIPRGQSRTFTTGPYARFQKVPLLLNASVAPVLKPVWGRMVIVYGAWQRFAAIAGLRDDRQPQELYDRELGKILLDLKTQFSTYGYPAGLRARQPWWEDLD